MPRTGVLSILTEPSTDATLDDMKTRQRLVPAERKRAILNAAGMVAMNPKVGFFGITRELVAAEAECSAGLVSKYYKTIGDLKKAVMREAIKHGNASIVADGLAIRDPIAAKAPAELIAEARKILASR